jgi:predicted RecA/RadA family phage recombinase
MSLASYSPSDPLAVVLAATAVSGVPFMYGNLLVFPITDGASGATIAVHTQGVHTYSKVTGTAWTVGMPLYWDVVNLKLTHTSNSAANPRVGSAARAQASGDTTGRVLLGHF